MAVVSCALCYMIFFVLVVSVYGVTEFAALSSYANPNAVVAIDGTGKFKKIMDAIAMAPCNSTVPYIIHIKKGIYNEYVTINKTNIVLVGDGIDITTITGSRCHANNFSTSMSATVGIDAPGFIAINLTIENSAAHGKGQAVALRINSDRSVLYQCALRGNQDTLYAYGGRQFYKKCIIIGTVDFIFGYATAVFQNCDLLARNATTNVVTANGRNASTDNTGFVLQFCNISRDIDLAAQTVNTSATYLGRPWGIYSRTVVMQSFIDSHIRPQGWLAWEVDANSTAVPKGKPYYGEFMNDGPGANLSMRVPWPGFHVLKSDEAEAFTVECFINGTTWLPSTGIPYIRGLS